jgi:hypothetical protein
MEARGACHLGHPGQGTGGERARRGKSVDIAGLTTQSKGSKSWCSLFTALTNPSMEVRAPASTSLGRVRGDEEVRKNPGCEMAETAGNKKRKPALLPCRTLMCQRQSVFRFRDANWPWQKDMLGFRPS